MFGAYFFLSEDIVIHTSIIYTFYNFLSDFGGLFQAFVLAFFYLIGKIIDDHYILGKMIRAQYYVAKHNAPKRFEGEEIGIDNV